MPDNSRKAKAAQAAAETAAALRLARSLPQAATAIPAATRRVTVPAYPAVAFGHSVRRVPAGNLAFQKIPDPLRELRSKDGKETLRWLAAEARLFEEWAAGCSDARAVTERIGELSRKEAPVLAYERVGRGNPGPSGHIPVVHWDATGKETVLLDTATIHGTATPIVSTMSASWYEGERYVVIHLTSHDGRANELRVFEMETGRQRLVVPHRGHIRGLETLDGRGTFAFQQGGSVFEVDAATGRKRKLGRLPQALGDVSISASPDDSRIIVSGHTPHGWARYVLDREANRKQKWTRLDGSTGGVTDAEAVGDRQYITSITGEGSRLTDDTGALICAVEQGLIEQLVQVDGTHVAVIVRRDGFRAVEVFRMGASEPDDRAAPPLPGVIDDVEFSNTGMTFDVSNIVTLPVRYSQEWRSHEGHFEKALRDRGLPPMSVEVLHARSHDGTDVPYVVAHRADVAPRPGEPLPTLVNVYGGFGLPDSEGFDPSLAAWAEAGGAVVVPMPRGGGARGPEWARDGHGVRKVNTVSDTIAVLEDLVTRRLTAPRMIGIEGASHGGWLALECAMLRPDLIGACAAHAPLSDLTSAAAEYGPGPSHQGVDLRLALSPLHHVLQWDRPVPSMFVTTGGHDDRVNPAESRQFVAAVQQRSPRTQCLYHHDPDADHFLASHASTRRLLGLRLSFFAENLGLVLTGRSRQPPGGVTL